jgi:formylglycine-generating enzyme required for sulfatase activity/tRNA A-37 threonylcarbamoyl transferase component Bud32
MVNPHDEELLAELLIEWEELCERGQEVPAGELCKEQPHLAEELARRIAAMKATDWLNNPDPPPDDPPAVAIQPFQGRVLAGRYRLDDLIAEGGFAQVWRAYDTELQRFVAVKVPKPGRLESSDSFMAEARRVARLKHPGIVPVHDVGSEDDQCFIVSEFAEGGSLAGQVSREKPSQDQVLRWMCEVADALEYAHLHGVIHRDIKPANILIDHHGRALLADFGIAQSARKTGGFAPSLGTLRYMSPEQLEGKPATPQSDIYSLGVVLHECLTGKLPYSAIDPTGLRREILAGAPPAPGNRLPLHIAGVCRTALSRSPDKRHTSAAHFAAALRRAEANRPMNGAGRVALLLMSLGAILGSGWYAFRPFPVPAVSGFRVALAATQPVEIELVPVGHSGNPADANGFGSVDYEYLIGRHEITIEQYCAFLNQVATSDPHGLYSERMAADASALAIMRLGTDGSYTYKVLDEAPVGHMHAGAKLKPRRPIVCVSWASAARFCNWLHNGQGSGSTETGAYALHGVRDRRVPREKDARFFLPTEDEWYKAAYFDAAHAGSGASYWKFGTRSNDSPSVWKSPGYARWDAESLELANIANWGGGGGGGDTLAPVDLFPNAISGYGCHCMSGNVAEWVEPKGDIAESEGIVRGGVWWEGAARPNSEFRVQKAIQTANPDIGFRVAAKRVSDK